MNHSFVYHKALVSTKFEILLRLLILLSFFFADVFFYSLFPFLSPFLTPTESCVSKSAATETNDNAEANTHDATTR